jgi:hypothetical protein
VKQGVIELDEGEEVGLGGDVLVGEEEAFVAVVLWSSA